MGLKEDLKAARKAIDKLNAYCDGLPKNSVPTPKYCELNTKANKALEKLPVGLRSTLATDLARLFVR